MSKSLVIVESPTKVKTIKKYLGQPYQVSATMGHLMDLPENKIGIDIEDEFKPDYIQIKGKQKIIKDLKKAAEDATDIYLAPDPDREGEAIAFHTAEILKKKGRRFYRVLFHELTPKAISEAIGSPSSLNRHKYDAQQARRLLDRLVGYQISPLLWQKVQRGLSAGRVQSVAVRIICERESEIQAFETTEYWKIGAVLQGETPPPFSANLTKKNQKAIDIPNEAIATEIVSELQQAKFTVEKIIQKTIKRNPQPPYITSKLQQEAIRRLKFSAKKTMIIAQQLYEGIELGPGEPVGLITYMRTDSTRIANDAAVEAITYIQQHMGAEYAMQSPRFFKNKKKVQDAHEAIRPTSVYYTPDQIKSYLTDEQYQLYNLIWKRFVASQMQQAIINQKTITIQANEYLFSVTGSTIQFQGFMVLYRTDEEKEDDEEAKQSLPDLSEHMILEQIKITPTQHFTQAPPRFTEASLVKELEENGIGRPSTYATILSTIQEKNYVKLENKIFKPTELGFIVNSLLLANFPKILDIQFTAQMETDLDQIETSEKKTLDILNQFYHPFKEQLEVAKQEMISIKRDGIQTDIDCPECQTHKLNIKIGKNGPFLSCSNYPKCVFSSNYNRDEKGNIHPLVNNVSPEIKNSVCTVCGKPMVIKQGKFGEFLACSGYPECKYTQSLQTASSNNTSIQMKCPEPGCEGDIVTKKTKLGKLFYGCNAYPKCTFAIWDKPVNKPCPVCEASFMVEKSTRKKGQFLACIHKDCTYEEPISE
ncbi:MAG: type I DNA topoisomerase [Desulfobacterales bacterium]|nr:type I DNA topoisomerase [Desulfobacterales bacterium]